MRARLIVVFLLSLVIGLIAVSHDSFWIDEAFSAHYSVQPTVAAWWHELSGNVGSDTQMPLYMIYLWAWEKLSGSSEWALRAANIPLFLLAQAAFWIGLRRWPRYRLCALVCAACNPFVWRYLNEARPYAMQYCGAAIVLSCLALVCGDDAPVISARWVLAFAGGLLVLFGSSALGIPWAGAAVLGLLCLAWRRARIEKGSAFIVALVAALVLLVALGGYCAWTVIGGHHGAGGLGHRLGSLCFAAYEVLGFSGFGPSRIQIIGSNLRDFVPYLPGLVPMGLLLGGVLVAGFVAFRRVADGRMFAAALLYTLVPLGMVVVLVYRADFHAVGRHFAPMVPLAVLAVALPLADAWRNHKRLQGAWTLLFLLFWLVSSLEIRFSPRHRRDDYRDAAAIANAALASGKRVWWVAADAAGGYYNVPLSDTSDGTQAARVIWRPTGPELAALPRPDVVIFSKPELFDNGGVLTAFLQTDSYRQVDSYPAFTIWEK